MKKILILMYVILIGAIIYSFIILNYNPSMEYIEVVAEPYKPILLHTSETEEITEEIIEEPIEEPVEVTEAPYNFHSYMSCDWDANDEYLLMKIAMAEAEGEDIEGKALVMMVILNRVISDEFPDTIEDVIRQEKDGTYQFSPVGSGRFDAIEPNEDCQKALDMIMIDKWDNSMGALYFESCDGESWHSRNLELLFKHGGHRFYK